jgi:hypothetical protein
MSFLKKAFDKTKAKIEERSGSMLSRTKASFK